jgi:hypothetical protein
MDPLIPIPREALAELLKAAGSPLTPEEYVASLSDTRTYGRYPSRARAAAGSKYVLLVVAAIAVVSTPLLWWFSGFSLENIIITVGLVVVTFFEYRVHRYFRERDERAPGLGFRNQSAFAAAILIYGLYHAVVLLQVSPQLQNMVETNNVIDPDTLNLMESSIPSLGRLFYLFIGVVGGLSQFGLAWYYRSARIKA